MLNINWLNKTCSASLVDVSMHQSQVREEDGAELVLLEPYNLFVGGGAGRIKDIIKSYLLVL